MSENPKVFISYSHQNAEYENKILNFANKLRSEGIDANVDLYEEAPAEGWPRWMENQIRNSDFVLVVSSKSYYNKCYSPQKGKGISWEVNMVYQQIYDSNSENIKFVPVFFDENDADFILTPLKPFTYYNISSKEDYEKLYWRLRGITKVQKPKLGKLRPLPQKERKTMFFSSPIDLDKWNTAHWKGMLYLFYPGNCPVLGLLYENYEIAKSIFSEWKNTFTDSFADKFLQVDFIIPPFPKNCWIYYNPERNYGKGYFVHIGPNITSSIDRAIDSGIELEEMLLTTVSRYQWMDEPNGSRNRDIFQEYINNNSEYLLIPIGIRNKTKPIDTKNLIIDFNYAIKMRSAKFQAGIDIKNDDITQVVLKKADN